MRLANLTYTASGVLLGLTLGFVLANNAFRASRGQIPSAGSETGAAVASQTALNAAPAPQTNNSSELSDQELGGAIARADSRPTDVKLQEEIGLAVSRYALLENRFEILPDAVRVLKRAADSEANRNNFALFAALGGAALVLFEQNGEQNLLNEARAAFQKAAQANSRDANSQIGLGLTYQLAQPADYQTAIEHYRRVLIVDQRNEAALEKLTAALAANKQKAEAEKSLALLKRINAKNRAIQDLEIRIAQIN